jgi:type IV secretion system protein VirB5
MKNPFKKEPLSYRPEPSLTPYQLAQAEWDERIGNARTQATNWRLIAILSATISIFLLIILISLLATKTEKIFIAEVTQSGRVVNISPLRVTYNPTVAQKEYFIGQFIDMMRSLPLDPVIAKKNWLTAYSFLSRQAATKFNTYLSKSNPIDLLGKKTVLTKIRDVNPLSESTIQIDWEETATDLNGQPETKNNYSGVFTIAIKQPSTQDEILRNPLGIHIVDFNISARTD